MRTVERVYRKLRWLPSYQKEVDSNNNIECAEMVRSSLGKQLPHNFAGSPQQIGVLRVLTESYEESSYELPDQESGSNKRERATKMSIKKGRTISQKKPNSEP